METNELEALVARYKELDAWMSNAAEEMTAIKRRIRMSFPEGSRLPSVSTGRVTIKPNRRFDVGLARQILTYDQIADCTDEPHLTSSLARKKLPPEVYEKCMTVRGDRVVVIG